MLAIAAALSAAAQTPDPAPLAPAGQWRIDYQSAGCALSRRVGTGEGLATLTVRPATVFGPVDLVINSSAQWTRGDRTQVVRG